MQPLNNYSSEKTLAGGSSPLFAGQQRRLRRKPWSVSQDLTTRRQSIASEDQYQSSQLSQISPQTFNITRRAQLIKSIVENDVQKVFSMLNQILENYLKRKQFANALFLMNSIISLANFFGKMKLKIQLFIQIAELLKQRKQLLNAIQILLKALEYAWLIRSNYYQLLIYDKIGVIQFMLGNIERAKYYHTRFTQNQLESKQSPAYIVGMENIKHARSHIQNSKNTKFNFDILHRSHFLPPIKDAPEPLTEEFLQTNLQLQTEQKFDLLSNVFLKCGDFLDQVQSIEPFQFQTKNQVWDSPIQKQIRRRVEAFDKIERRKNHVKVKKALIQMHRNKINKEPFQIPKCINIHRMIEERIKYTRQPINFEELYRQVKHRPLSLNRDQKRINLPVLVSHRSKQ